MTNDILTHSQVFQGTYEFFQTFRLPIDEVHRRQVLTVLDDIFRGTNSLPADSLDIDASHLHKASLRGYQGRIFDEAPDPIQSPYEKAYKAYQKLRDQKI